MLVMTGGALVTLLAFGFASPWLLAGLTLAAVPIVIHLLDRRQYRETSWAAMRFLLAATQRHAKRLRLEQLILLAVRTMIPVLVALALARPYFETNAAARIGNGSGHVVLVVDTSFSMGLRTLQSTAFDRARETAQTVVRNSSAADRFQLVRITGGDDPIVIRQPSASRDALVQEIDRLTLSEARGDVNATLAALLDLAESADEFIPREIIFISDFQSDNWRPPEPADRERIQRQIAQLADDARVVCVDVGTDAAENYALTGFEAAEAFILAGRPVRLRATVRNFSAESLQQVSVELLVDGRIAASGTIDCPPEEECRVEFSQLLPTSGEYQLEARLPEDGLPLDDRRWLVLPVKNELTVLLVDGGRVGQPGGSAARYVRLALQPERAGQASSSGIRPVVLSGSELDGADFALYDCVLLANVPDVSEETAARLKAYVDQGGGLVVALGDQVESENYNRLLFRNGEGILPAELKDRQKLDSAATQAFLFDVNRYEHPALQAFRGNPDTGLETALTFAYIQVEPAPDPGITVPLRFVGTGDPAIVVGMRGLGRVALVTTALDESWGTWPVLSPSFVPLMHELVRYVAAGGWDDRQRLVGQPLRHVSPTNVTHVEAAVQTPSERLVSLQSRFEQNAVSVNFPDTSASGIYELRLGPPVSTSQQFAVNVDPRESDPAKLTRDALARDIFGESTFAYRGFRQQPAEDADTSGLMQTLLSRKILWLAFCLLFVEQLMAWRFAYGLAALAGLLVVTLASWGSPAVEGWAAGAVIVLAVLLWAGLRGRQRRRATVVWHSPAGRRMGR